MNDGGTVRVRDILTDKKPPIKPKNDISCLRLCVSICKTDLI
jgi:hypothetical protein